MARLDPSRILAAWEGGQGRRPLDRALVVLWAAGLGGGDLADWPLERRDRALLETRRALLGDRLALAVPCAGCDAELEIDLSVSALLAGLPVPSGAPVRAAGHEIALRPLTSADLAAMVAAPEDSAADVIRARLAGPLPEAARAAVDAEIERRAGAAELKVRLSCPDCGADWAEPLDLPGLVWTEIDAAARRLLGEVADLARAFGWSEPQVLALSPARRAAYLSLARAA